MTPPAITFFSFPAKQRKETKESSPLPINYLKRNYDTLNKTNSSGGLRQRFVLNAALIPFLPLEAEPIIDRRRMGKALSFC